MEEHDFLITYIINMCTSNQQERSMLSIYVKYVYNLFLLSQSEDFYKINRDLGTV